MTTVGTDMSTSGSKRHCLRAKPKGLLRTLIGLCLVILSTLTTQTALAAVLAGWDVSKLTASDTGYGPSPYAPTTVDANLTVTGLTRGSGVGTSGTAANRAWGGNGWTTASLAAAVAGNTFTTIPLKANTGYSVSYTSISKFSYRRSGSGPTTGVVQYQVGNAGFVDIATVSYSSTSSSGASLPAIDLSGIAGLQNVAAEVTVTFRIVNYGGSAASGTWYVFDAASSTSSDFEISGVVKHEDTNQVRVETRADGSGAVVPAQAVESGTSIQAFAVTRDANGGFLGNVTANWSLTAVTGGIVPGDLIASSDGRSAVFTPHAKGSAIINAAISGFASISSGVISVSGSPFTIYHVNDTHARLTPHKWIIPSYGWEGPVFEDVGGAAYLAGAVEHLTSIDPNSLFIDAGDISEGNPVGDMGGNSSMTQFYALLSARLATQPGRAGRGIDAMVVGNHDVRDASYVSNIDTLHAAGVPVISVNIRDKSTHTPYFDPYTIVTLNGTKIGILGYTTSAAEVGASLANSLEVAECDWNGSDSSKVHLAPYINQLRNSLGCDVVILAAHVGHTVIATDTTRDGDTVPALLIDDGAAKLPEVAITGHWHTWAGTAWQPYSLNYKTIFAESASYMKYVGELRVSGAGRYLSASQHVVRDSEYTADPAVELLVENLKTQYNTAHPEMPLDQILGYTADDLLLDNDMKWWSPDEYPWNGNNTAGQWICDAMQWKAASLFGQCDLAIETGGGVRSDIPAGPVTYTQVYEVFPWSDDTFYRVNMTGQDIINFLKTTNCNAGFSRDLEVTAFDGVPTLVKFKGQPIDVGHTYTVAINNYMYNHPPAGWTWTDGHPLTSNLLCRDGIVEYMQQFSRDNPYTVGGPRYHLNTEFSGGYRAVVLMMNDDDTRPSYEDAFIRFLSATSDTLIRRGTPQVPADLVNEDGTISPSNRLAEEELYRSYLGFKKGALLPGDIIEVWGKGSFYRGNPEFVDQEGIYGDGSEFQVLGHDNSLAKPTYVHSIDDVVSDFYKNHYVKFLARRATSDTVTDQNGHTLKLWDATAYASKGGLPGSIGDLLLVTGVPSMKNYGTRFRCASAELASSYGITGFPADSDVVSSMTPVPVLATAGSVTLTAKANASSSSKGLYPIADAQVISAKPTTNDGARGNFYVQSSNSGSFHNERGWLKFDLSTLPAGATVTSAKLSTYCWSAAGPSLVAELHATGSGWTETGITWNNQPALGAILQTQTLVAGTKNVWYDWDVTSYVNTQLAGDKVASFMIKAAEEDSAADPAPSYSFDAKEYGSNSPVLEVTFGSSTGATVAGVNYYYRYSADGTSWGNWTLAEATTAAPFASDFSYHNGYGYYEFYSQAAGSNGSTESIPAFAQASVHYVKEPEYITRAIIKMTNLAQVYNGSPRSANITTVPPGLAYGVTYGGSPVAPVHPGTYNVEVAVTQPGYTGNASAVLTLGKGPQTINWSALPPVTLDSQPFTLQAQASTNLPITYVSGDPSVATVTGAVVTLVGKGTTTITASQAGNDDYLPASAVQTLVVNDVPPAKVPTTPPYAFIALVLLLGAAGTYYGLRYRQLTLPKH